MNQLVENTELYSLVRSHAQDLVSLIFSEIKRVVYLVKLQAQNGVEHVQSIYGNGATTLWIKFRNVNNLMKYGVRLYQAMSIM